MGHLQLYVPSVSMHVPPFVQGFVVHHRAINNVAQCYRRMFEGLVLCFK